VGEQGYKQSLRVRTAGPCNNLSQTGYNVAADRFYGSIPDGYRNGRGHTREQEAWMARSVLRSLRRALTPRTHDNQSVHFHNGPHGQPEVCFDHSCSRPRLNAR
jgi:hypothetical protein